MGATTLLRTAIWVLLATFAAAAIAPSILDTHTATLLCIYALLALSLGFIWGFGGILCFGQAAFFGLGGYAYALAALNFNGPWAAFFIAILVPLVFAAALGAILFYGRLTDVYLAILTLVVTLILFEFVNSTAGSAYHIGNAPLGGFNGIPGFPVFSLPWDPNAYFDDAALFHFSLALLAFGYFGFSWLLRAPFGRVLVAIGENEQRAELLGYDIRLLKTAAFAIGGGIAGLAGCLFANWAEIVTPGLFSLGQSAEIIIWVIVGGLGTLLGPIVGAALLGYMKIALGQQSIIDNSFVMGMLLLLVVLFLPEGILPTIMRLFGRYVKRRNPARGRGKRRARHEVGSADAV